MPENIVWAVDPFTSQRFPLAKSRHMLATLQKIHPITVEPVSVVSPKEAGWPHPFEARWAEGLAAIAGNSLKEIGSKLRLPEVAEPKILVEESERRADSIRALIEFARNERAKFILVNLHSREGLRRFRIGGFTEALFAASPLPVIAIRANSQVPGQIKKIALATDLTGQSRAYFSQVLELAKYFGAELRILHRLEIPPMLAADWIGFAAAAEVEGMRELMREHEALRKERGEALVKEAKEAGVKARFILLGGLEPLAPALIRAAGEQQADILAISVQDHSLSEKILGGTAREILRLSPRPVLVLPGRT